MKTLLFLALLIALQAQAQEIRQIRGSDFDANTVLRAPNVPGLMLIKGDDTATSLRALMPKAGGTPAWFVVLNTEYMDKRWRIYTSASLAGGEVLPAQSKRVVISCDHGLCRFSELASVELTPAAVVQGRASGLRIRWNADSPLGPFETEIPASHFAAMAEAVKQ